jgi:hypothetical protein
LIPTCSSVRWSKTTSRPARIAAKLLGGAERSSIATPCLCEFVWVLLRLYQYYSEDVARASCALATTKNVEMNRPAVEADLRLRQGAILRLVA